MCGVGPVAGPSAGERVVRPMQTDHTFPLAPSLSLREAPQLTPAVRVLRAPWRRVLGAGLMLWGLCWATSPARAGGGVPAPAAASAPIPAASTAAAAPRYEVRIDAPKELAAALRRGLDIERWKDFPDLRQEQLRSLVSKLPQQARQVSEALGYFSPRIDVRLESARKPEQVLVRVEPGEPTRVESVQLSVRGPDGRDLPALAAQLRRHWGLREGSVFVSASWQAAKGDALLRLDTHRFAAARVAYSRALVDPARHAARLSVRFDTGPDYRFGSLKVHGLERYPESVVRNLVPWSRGDAYSQQQLLQSQASLQDSGYFRMATVAAPVSAAHGDEIPVSADLVENPAQTLGLGLGFSSNTGARTQLDYGNLNLLGHAWRLDSRIKFESLQQSLGARLHFPQRANGADYSLRAKVQHSDIQGLTTRSQSLGAQRQRIDGPIETTQFLDFINEQQQITGGPVSSSMALMPGYSWTRRRLDSTLDPRRGNLLNAQISGGAQALLSDQNFVRLYLHALQYVPLGKRDQLIVRGELGAVISPSSAGIPQQVLFRAGGVGSVRGYAYQSLGVDEDGAVLGGRALLTASIEGVHWVLPDWGAALFVDAGNAANSFASLSPVVGYGVGVRWRSPVGLVSVDIAHGRATGATRLEFNAGVSF